MQKRSPEAGLLITLLVFLCVDIFHPALIFAYQQDQLIIFTQAKNSKLSETFEFKFLPEIQNLTDNLGISLHVIRAKTGAPDEVAITPLIVFQNYRGRSIFQGRYTDLNTIAHFIRTSRAIPQGRALNQQENIPVWRHGRAVIAAPIKITKLAGALPKGYDEEVFKEVAKRAILNGFSKFQEEKTVVLRRTDRSFYMDFYPYLSNEELMVSLALYSQFNCIEPVFVRFENPVRGKWGNFERIFSEAGKIFEEEVLQQIRASTIGDGFNPISSSVPLKSWEELGLALPNPSKEEKSQAVTDVQLAKHWVVDDSDNSDSPRLQFRFLPPMDSYAGEATDLTGELHLGDDPDFESTNGWIEVTINSSTMGSKDLDATIHTKIIKIRKYPKARFTLTKIEGAGLPLAFGEIAQIDVFGTFELVGKSIPMVARAQIEPIFAENNKPQLHITATSKIRLKESFNIEGPLGPMPASDILVFYLDFMMQPASNN